MTQYDIIQHIERFAPLAIAASWDNSGMQIAALRRNCTHIAVSLDPSLEILQKTIDIGADFLLCHHPLSMSPRFLGNENDYTAFVRQAFIADMPVYAAHTSLDANPLGPVSWLADELGLKSRTVLEPTANFKIYEKEEIECGFGLVGKLDTPLSFAELKKKLLSFVPGDTKAAINQIPTKNIQTIALCPGSGSSLVSAAIQHNADIFITGDVKYHTALDANLPIIDLGHFLLEEIMMQRFADILQKQLPSLKVTFLPARNPLKTL